MVRWTTWINLIVFLALSVVMLVNSTFLNSPFVGVPVVFALLYIGAVAVGEVFFPSEGPFFKRILGLATFVMMLAMIGAVLLLTARFTEILSLVLFVVVGVFFCFLSSLRKGGMRGEGVSSKLRIVDGMHVSAFLHVSSFLLSVGISFYGLLVARTGEGNVSVWLTIPNFFMPAFFFSALFLVFILFFTRLNISLKLVLLSVFSFLAHSLFVLVWYPGRYGDPWLHLGEARYIDRVGKPYNYELLVHKFLFVSPASGIADLLGSKTQYALVVFFRRMFSVDIFWVHIFLVPLIWAIFVPLFSYKMAELLTSKKSSYIPILAAVGMFFSPILIDWGTVSVPNTLGFLFFLFTVLLILYWMNYGGKKIWLLALLATLTTALAHPQPGVFAVIFFIFATIFQKLGRASLKVVGYFVLIASYPMVLYLRGAGFSFAGFLTLEPLIYFQGNIISLPFVLGVLGIVSGLSLKRIKGKFALILLAFYAMVLIEFFISAFWMQNLPFSAVRTLVIADLLFVPFIGLGVLAVFDVLKVVLSWVKGSFLKAVKINPSRFIALLLVCVFFSTQATLSLYQAYPHEEMVVLQPTAYEIEAIRYIDSTAQGRYVALWDTVLSSLAIGVLGSDYTYGGNPHGLVGRPEFYYPTYQYFKAMITKPSFSTMENAMTFASADVAYLVVSAREYEYLNIVQRVSEVLPVDKVFGDGKLYVFKYPLPTYEGVGPAAKVVFDNELIAYVETKYSYMVKSEVNYNLTLSGHSSYNITDYPQHWAFGSLTVNRRPARFDEATDVNEFVYINGLVPNDVLTVIWHANDNYQAVRWKDESFETGWRRHHLYAGNIVPNITTDGNILSLSWDFAKGPYQYYYYERFVNVSAGETRYVIIRWKSTGPVAVLSLSYDVGALDITFGGESSDWSRVTVEIPSEKVLEYITVGISNLLNMDISGVQTLYVDYILVVSQSG